MTDRAKELIDQAQALSPEEREQIGTARLDSIDDDADRERRSSTTTPSSPVSASSSSNGTTNS